MVFGKLFKTINQAPQIVISVAEGFAIAGGFGLACASDLIMSMPDTKLERMKQELALHLHRYSTCNQPSWVCKCP